MRSGKTVSLAAVCAFVLMGAGQRSHAGTYIDGAISFGMTGVPEFYGECHTEIVSVYTTLFYATIGGHCYLDFRTILILDEEYSEPSSNGWASSGYYYDSWQEGFPYFWNASFFARGYMIEPEEMPMGDGLLATACYVESEEGMCFTQ